METHTVVMYLNTSKEPLEPTLSGDWSGFLAGPGIRVHGWGTWRAATCVVAVAGLHTHTHPSKRQAAAGNRKHQQAGGSRARLQVCVLATCCSTSHFNLPDCTCANLTTPACRFTHPELIANVMLDGSRPQLSSDVRFESRPVCMHLRTSSS